MNPLIARWIYCVGLFVLTACAVLPEPQEQAASAPAAQPAMATEVQLARVMRERAELSLLYGERHPAMIKAAAAESALRDAGLAADPAHFHRDLIRALSTELADARQKSRELATLYGDRHPEMLRAETVVSALTSAINAEVHFVG
jgi:uncharacterized protein involved in exopolysaccharide biosynthesis